MPKRAERRHHENRVKNKFRRELRDIEFRDLNHFNNDVRKSMYGMHATPIEPREKVIEDKAVRMAHHPRHQCSMCKPDPKYDRAEARRKEKRILEDREQ